MVFMAAAVTADGGFAVPVVVISSLPRALENLGVLFERWDVKDVSLDGIDLKNVPDGLVLQIVNSKANENRIYDFRTTVGTISIIILTPETPESALAKFKPKHTHDDDEIRLILAGEGVFTIWGEDGAAYDVPVKTGDFVFIPKGVVHTFLLTATHQITALRVFKNAEGWVPRYVENDTDDGKRAKQ
jgi:1,2-dihydroxy-3-keto-5-methylthiopentene dioxygenase